jgi:large subunit ribosomal protein L5
MSEIKNIKSIYLEEAAPFLIDSFKYKNKLQVPKLEKIVVNVGCGDAVANSKIVEGVFNELYAITGQKPVATIAKHSNASFKLREGMKVGVKVTLRRQIMYNFLEKLIYVVLPRNRDFKGFSRKSFDGNGNFSFGVKEQIAFPEIDYDKIDKVRGMDVTINTSANNDVEAYELLKLLRIPFYN